MDKMVDTLADDIFKHTLLNENVRISIQISLKFVPDRRQAITWTNVDPIYWRIYASLGGDELNKLDHSLTITTPLVKWTKQGIEMYLQIAWVMNIVNIMFTKSLKK